MWPSFYWYILSNRDIVQKYGCFVWKFIPITWRHWWLPVINQIPSFNNVSANHPPTIFIDKSETLSIWNKSLESGKIGDLKNACNKVLFPNVLCPWGCTEFIQECGSFPVDVFFQRILRKCRIHLVTKNKNRIHFIESAREDYIRNSMNSYDCWLFNPEWKIMPSIMFNNDNSPVIFTCKNHNEGTKKKYIHVPRQPNHILPSSSGDQLAHAVIKLRSIRPLKTTKYVNSYQMHEERGSFQGIDTCNITTFGDFSKTSILLDESESRSITCRRDVNMLLSQLQEDSVIYSFTVDGMRDRAKKACPSKDILDDHLRGSTFVSAYDAMSLQKMVGESPTIEVIKDMYSNEDSLSDTQMNRIRKGICKRNWPQIIVHCQVFDPTGYGCNFPTSPCFQKKYPVGQLLWCISGILTKVPILWKLTNDLEFIESYWHGWLLTYLSKKCFSSIVIRSDRMNPFKL